MTNIVKYEEQQSEMSYFEKLCKNAMKSGKYPAEMNEATMLNIMLTAKDLGISPMKAINGGFYIVNGKISMSTALQADRIRSAGHSVKVTEWTKDKCVIIGIRKDNGDSCKVEFTIEDAQTAGLLGSPTWKKYPKPMLYNRAMSLLARVLFPDVVGNSYSEDEAFDIKNVPPAKRPDLDPDNLPLAAVEISNAQKEVKPEPQECPTLNDLDQRLAMIGTEAEAGMLEAFVKMLAIKHGKTEEVIIKSALQNDEQLNRFADAFAKSLEEKKA